jgi:hypothetical protein
MAAREWEIDIELQGMKKDPEFARITLYIELFSAQSC